MECGRREGKSEGREETTRIIVGNMLNRNMPIEDICVLAECSREFVEKVVGGFTTLSY